MSNSFGSHIRNATFRGIRFIFRLLPLSQGTRDRLRQHFFDRYPTITPLELRGRDARANPHRPLCRSDQPAIGFVSRHEEPLPSLLPAKLVAFYLPQFHTIPENDAWWGRGFTEWRNVARALPQFEGHVQPRLPEDLGYYDLRNPQTMRDQAKLASEYGVGAFCFYFYWFGGKTLLEEPLEHWLQDRTIDLPFCLCWANESWSRSWDGRAGDILIEQSHNAQDDLAFIAHVARYLRDSRYLRIDGKPLLLVYRPNLFPDVRNTADCWRKWCRENDIGEIFIAYVQGFECSDPRDFGFDAAVEFPPNLSNPTNITNRQRLINPGFSGQVVDWRELVADYQQRPMPEYRLFPGVNCGWDNQPRRPGQGRTYLHSSPRRYGEWLHHTITTRLAPIKESDRLVFVNAWNEWAEGAVLEPDSRLGYAWLQATRSALQRAASLLAPVPSPLRLNVVVHAWYPDTFDEVLETLQGCGLPLRLIVTTAPEKVAHVRTVLYRRNLEAEVEVFENRGRDVLPFLHIANRLLEEGENIVLKLHTKHSPHLRNGDSWRNELITRLLSSDRAERILRTFSENHDLGMVAPEGHVQSLADFWGGNEDAVNHLATRIGITIPQEGLDMFVPGSMFWIRLDALRPLLDAHLGVWEFEPETGQLDGTLAHAIERMFALCVRAQGLTVETAAAVCDEPDPSIRNRYPYAERT